MLNNVYVLYNNLAKRYNDVFAYPTDEFAAARLREAYPAPRLEELELCRVGTYSLETGIFETHAPIRVPLGIGGIELNN